MSSLLTNASAMSALRVLAGTQRALSGVQDQVSTGLRVANASDDAAYWSIGTTMKARTAGLGAVQDSLALTKSVADVTAAALGSVIGAVQGIQADIVTAATPGVDVPKVQADIAAKQKTILSTIQSASFNGQNWLMTDEKYVLTETTNSTRTFSATKATVQALDNTGIKTVSGSYGFDNHDVENVSITGPNGYLRTFSDDLESVGTVSRTLGSFSRTVTSNSPIEGLSPPSDHAETSTLTTPASYADSGVLGAIIPDFNIFNVGLTIQNDATLTINYSDSSETSSSSTTNSQTFHSAGFDAIWAAAQPRSLLSPLLNLDVTNTAATAQNNLDTAASTLSALTSVASRVGALQNQIAIQQSFNASLSDALTTGLGSLVDADMNLASTRLQALQTQQQLGIQALSIANDNSRQILKLFA